MITTNPNIEGRPIAEYKRIVTGDAIVATSIFRDISSGISAAITYIIGGRSGACEQEVGTARDTALRETEERAAALGATAVVGVDLYSQVIRNMLMVSASGTAVRLG